MIFPVRTDEESFRSQSYSKSRHLEFFAVGGTASPGLLTRCGLAMLASFALSTASYRGRISSTAVSDAFQPALKEIVPPRATPTVVGWEIKMDFIYVGFSLDEVSNCAMLMLEPPITEQSRALEFSSDAERNRYFTHF